MTPHVADARRAAAHLLLAAVAGGTAEEAIALMHFASDLWPEPPLCVGKGSPIADSPSAKAWTNAHTALEQAQAAQGERLKINWEDRAKAEALIDRAFARPPISREAIPQIDGPPHAQAERVTDTGEQPA